MTGKQEPGDKRSFHVLVAGLVVAPVAMLTGPYNWWLNYAGKWSKIIAIKIFGSLILITLILVIFHVEISCHLILCCSQVEPGFSISSLV